MKQKRNKYYRIAIISTSLIIEQKTPWQYCLLFIVPPEAHMLRQNFGVFFWLCWSNMQLCCLCYSSLIISKVWQNENCLGKCTYSALSARYIEYGFFVVVVLFLRIDVTNNLGFFHAVRTLGRYCDTTSHFSHYLYSGHKILEVLVPQTGSAIRHNQSNPTLTTYPVWKFSCFFSLGTRSS